MRSSGGTSTRYQRLQAITDVALSHLELDQLLHELLLRIRDALDADTCAILLLDEATNELVARAAVGIEEEVEQGVRIPVGRGFAGRIAAERRPVALDSVDHSNVMNPILRQKGIKSLLGAPLLVRGKPLGVVHVGTQRPRVFTDDDVELLELAADRAALAIERARAFEAERRARTRLESVQAVTDTALAHLDLDELLAELLPRIREILAVDTCAILLLDEATNELVARAAVGIEEEVEQGVRIPVGRGFAGRIAAERRPVVLDSVDHSNVMNPILRQKGIKSLLGAPLLARGAPVGVVHVGSLTPRRFQPDEVELLQLVADRIALAIEKARVHEETVRLDQLKLNFVAVASHELRTPATSIYGVVATLCERRDELSEETKQRLDEVLWEQSDRMRRLIEQLLDLSRLDAGKLDLHPQTVELRPLLEEIAASFETEPELAIMVDAPAGLTTEADPLALERVVSNLISNALRHGRPPIMIAARLVDCNVEIAVEDAGEGVPDDLLPRLFERFERGTLESGGSGLGLAIAKAYAVAHGGDLRYRPQPSGARFELIL